MCRSQCMCARAVPTQHSSPGAAGAVAATRRGGGVLRQPRLPREAVAEVGRGEGRGARRAVPPLPLLR
jgi:hypothetical protein